MQALIVDDSRSMRRIITNALPDKGISGVMQAEDGEQALQSIKENEDIGLVLLDWNMPNKDGFETLKEIRADGYTMPVIMVTTEAEKQRVVEAIKAGANNYVVKPFTPDVIQKKIKDTCQDIG